MSPKFTVMAEDVGNAINTLAFIDLETTGLSKDKQITELSIIAVSVDSFLESADHPRIQNKITICFNPEREIEVEASNITGLTNRMLLRQSNFNQNAMNLLECFLQHLEQPICFIAHNGDQFDFPLLGQRFKSLSGIYPSSTKWCDSIPVFKRLTPNLSEEKLSFSLKEVHKRAFHDIPEILHSAEADVYTLMKCARSFGQAFVDAVKSSGKSSDDNKSDMENDECLQRLADLML